MSFDWIRFFNRFGIEHVSRGPNVSQGNVNIRCPFCGASDESHHLGVSLKGLGWGCWRNAQHRGKKPHRLIQALTGFSSLEVDRIVGDKTDVDLGADSTFGDQIKQMVNGGVSQVEEAARTLEFPANVRIIDHQHHANVFRRYLIDRGYKGQEVFDLCKKYDLRYATTGPFKYRIVIPVYMPQGLVNWTGRDISGWSQVRYKTLTTDKEKAEVAGLPLAVLSIDKTLFNYKELMECDDDTLVVVEGPFDALNVDFRGYPDGVRATCFFGKNMSEDQSDLLSNLASKFKRRILLLDRDASLDAMRLSSRLEYLGFQFKVLPSYIKDPAEMNLRDIDALFS